jgi:AcrR family transcriptional regulator
VAATRRQPGTTRERLLAAAAAVVRREGPQRLTLDSVAAEAGTSKGGLLYHFPTKRALVDALVARWLDRFEEDVTREAQRDGRPGAWARAYLRASDLRGEPREEWETDFALLAVVVEEPERLAVVRERYAALQARLEDDGLDPAVATAVRLAADGLWFADLLGLAPPREELRAALMARLAALAE